LDHPIVSRIDPLGGNPIIPVNVEGIDMHGQRQEGMGWLIGVRLAAMSNSGLPMHTPILVT
jgi:hypothetical protein